MMMMSSRCSSSIHTIMDAADGDHPWNDAGR